jgi:hypothetical protein
MASMIFVCHPINGQVRTTFLRTIDPYYKRKGYKWLIMATVITSIVLWNYYPFNCYVTCSLFLRFWYLILELFRQLGIVFHFMYLHLLELFRQLGIVFHSNKCRYIKWKTIPSCRNSSNKCRHIEWKTIPSCRNSSNKCRTRYWDIWGMLQILGQRWEDCIK